MRRLFVQLTRSLLLVLACHSTAFATQGHGGMEGIYVHQLAHVVFAFSMGMLIFWLRQRGLTRDPGWRFIQYAAGCFVIWNLDAMLVHALEEQWALVSITPVGMWRIEIHSVPDVAWLKYLYFVAKMDHLFCVPAMVFLYAGLKRLVRMPLREPSEPGAS